MDVQYRGTHGRHHFESACRRSLFLRSIWNTRVSTSRFVSLLRDRNVVALHHGVYAETIYLARDEARSFSPLFRETMTVGSFVKQSRVPPALVTHTVRLLTSLLRQGFLVPDGWDRQKFREPAAGPKMQKAFASLTVFLTPACNLNCHYCQDVDVISKRRRTMTLQTLDRALDVLRETPRGILSQKRSIQFFGGEPLVDPVMFRRMVMHIRKREEAGAFGREGIGIHLLTNGTLLDEANILFLKQNRVLLSVSLDGPRRFHDQFRRDRQNEGTHSRVLNGIARARKRGLDVTIESIVTDSNLEALPRFMRSMRDRFGIREYSLNFLIGSPAWQKRFRLTPPRNRLAEIFGRLLDIEGICIEPLASRWNFFLKGLPLTISHSCMDGSRLVVYPDGGAAPCPACGEKKGMPRLAPMRRLIGTAFWRQFSETASLVDPDCVDQCTLIGFCDGGCPLNAMNLGPTNARPECEIAHAMLQCFVWRRWRRLKEEALNGGGTTKREEDAHRSHRRTS